MVNGIDFGGFALNLSGSVANTGIAGQGTSSGIAVPGGLVRANSATNGHAQPYDPYTISLIDSLGSSRGNHYLKIGGEIRAIRMSTDRIGGITYTFANVTAFLANQAATVQYLGDLSAPSPFNNGATGERHIKQEYYVAYAQDEWHVAPKATLNYGLRYDYYTPLREANDLIVKFNIDTGVIDPNTTPLVQVEEEQLPAARRRSPMRRGQDGVPRRLRHVRRPGPDRRPDPADRERPRQLDASATAAFPVDSRAAGRRTSPTTRTTGRTSRAPTPTSTRFRSAIYQYTASVQQDLGGRYTATAAYIGSQGRNLFLRSVANQITQVVTNPNPAANALRHPRVLDRPARRGRHHHRRAESRTPRSTTRPAAGTTATTRCMLQLRRRASTGVSLNVAVHAGQEHGQHGRVERSAHRRATTRAR